MASASKGLRRPSAGFLPFHSDELEALALDIPVEACVESSFSTHVGCKTTPDIVHIIEGNKKKTEVRLKQMIYCQLNGQQRLRRLCDEMRDHFQPYKDDKEIKAFVQLLETAKKWYKSAHFMSNQEANFN